MNEKNNILHLLVSGNAGGIETLCKDISNLSKKKNYFCFVFSGGVVADEMKDNNANVIEVGIKSSKSLLSFIHKLKEICIKNKIDKIITHHSAPIFWIACIYIKKILKIPFYIYVHGNIKDELRLSQKLAFVREQIFVKASNKSNGVICISQSVAKSVLDKYYELKPKIQVIYNGVDTKKFRCKRVNTNTNTIIFIGRLIHEKGVHILLNAISYIKDNEEIQCIIIGDGLEKHNLEKKCEDLGISQIVKFYGTQRDILKWLKQGDVFVHPAIWEEGFGITIVEAMASGIPCIAFNKGAIPEIIDNKINGFIVQETDDKQLAETLKDVLYLKNTNNEQWRKISSNAIEKARKFDISIMIDELDKYIS